MSLREESTDGKSGMDNAKKQIEGSYPEPTHGYSGEKSPDGNLINAHKVDYGDKIEEKPLKKKVVKTFPFIKEGDQEHQFPSPQSKNKEDLE